MYPDRIVTALRIMIVEDDALIASLLAELLESMGHIVCANVETQAKAVAAAEYDRPQFMIVDAYLEEGNGISAVAQILRGGYVPHIFVTGDPARVKAAAPGAIIVQKPYRMQDLKIAIDRARTRSDPAVNIAP